MKKSATDLAAILVGAGLPRPELEYRFAPPRKWRFDVAWPSLLRPCVALEIEGGAWIRGRHTRGSGFISDIRKYNEAALRGWVVLRATPKMVASGEVFPWLERALLGE